MLAVVLVEDDAIFRSISHRLRLHRFSVIRYRDPVKLSDNLGEILPDLLVVRHEDFPLHGEVLASQLQHSRNLADYSVCILIPAHAPSPIAEGSCPGITVVREGEPGPDGASRAFASYLSAFLAPGSESSQGANPSGSRLVAAASRREKRNQP